MFSKWLLGSRVILQCFLWFFSVVFFCGGQNASSGILGRKSHCGSEDMIIRLPFILRISRIQPIRGEMLACGHSVCVPHM